LRRFIGYRPQAPLTHYTQGVANAPNQAQFEGVVFTDGTVAVRWLTQYQSTSLWTDWNTFYQVHGHPEYGTIIEWLDGDEWVILKREEEHAPLQALSSYALLSE
jgi:hypothetical protein